MGEESKIGIKVEEEAKPLKKLCEKLEESINAEFNKGIEQIDVMEMKEAIDMLKDLYYAKEKMVKGCYYKYIMEAMEKEEEEKKKKEKEKDDDEEEWDDDGRKGYRGQPRDSMGRYMSRRGRRGRKGYEEPMYFTMTPEMYHEYEPEELRDMDKEMGRMYYSGSGSSGGQGGGNSGRGGSSSGMGGVSSQGGGQSSGGSSGGSGGNRGYSEGRQSEGGNYSSRMQDGGRDYREGKSGQMRKGYMEAKEQGKEKGEKMKNLEDYMKSIAEDITEAIEGASPEERSMTKQKLQMIAQKM